ncbi:GNAT family N-acetyltransferase [Lutispora thermophila]|uniref:Acetyltransferase (GNAT) family protein n=1 Tax=Lutispora thermophila DSM 19022 TaxID=1122184 RepID=A0A1M6EGA5_9FIRM|nr:GNAT family N-acetyltransferase [Lutispora thermophila]SHI84328.1 Acetyltransferase (GNAT) family protein [Lutispora thermophila DSM 19022]
MAFKNCKDVGFELIYQCFNQGFSDYIVNLHLPLEEFKKRFFGPEGNELKNSFIAIEEERPVGLILGGIKDYNGIKTMRCGALCIIPDYRGKGIADELFYLHKERAISEGCKMMMLETIIGNDRALNFYKKHGYEKVYELQYFQLSDLSKFEKFNNPYDIKPIEFSQLKEIRDEMGDVYINWQNDLPYIEKSEGQHNYGAFIENKIVGVLSINEYGRINLIWVNKKHRGQGIATGLLRNAIDKLNLIKLGTSFPNNHVLYGFYKKLGFEKEKVAQYEMFMIL